ncbi:MAG: heavy metal translocating P-type ATPase [Candidatus Ranarchaeia archaeon]
MKQEHETVTSSDISSSCSTCGCSVKEEIDQEWKKKININIVLSAIFISLGYFVELFLNNAFLSISLFIFSIIITGREIIINGIKSLILKRKITINLLMTIAAVGSFFIGHGEEGAGLLFLFYIAEYLEKIILDNTTKSVGDLVKLAPEYSILKENGEEKQILTLNVKKGDILLVKPGDRISLDGVVVRGESTVNQSTITGESLPVFKKKGDTVYAGTVNESSFLEFQVSKVSSETLLSKIIQLVEEARNKKAPTERQVDKFAKYYTPAVVLTAVIIFVVPIFLFNQPFDIWLYRALNLLVISCPCALVISTPVTILSGIKSAARKGVLVKGGKYIEEIGATKMIAFDKTGTLTKGKPEIIDIVSFDPKKYTEENIIEFSTITDFYSKHPLSNAIREKAQKFNQVLKEPDKYKYFPGKGNVVEYEDNILINGNAKLLELQKIQIPEEITEKINSFYAQGKTLSLIAKNSEIIGLVSFADPLKENTIEIIEKLRNKKIKIIILSGDNEKTAKAIASRLGIEDYYSNLSPQDKLEILGNLKKEYKKVVMVGDGVNDAPALALADVSIAMGAIGSDAAIETSDIALINDDLEGVLYLINLSKRTTRLFKQNILISLFVKGILTFFAIFGFITLWMGIIIGDVGLTLLVTLFSSQVNSKD